MNQDLARPSVFFRFLSVLLALLLGGLFGSAQAHSTSDHLLNLTVTGRQVQGSWDVMLTDLDYTLRLDQDGDQRVGNEEMRVSGQRVRDYLLAHLQVRAAGHPQYIQLADASHAMVIEQPAVLAGLITDFLGAK